MPPDYVLNVHRTRKTYNMGQMMMLIHEQYTIVSQSYCLWHSHSFLSKDLVYVHIGNSIKYLENSLIIKKSELINVWQIFMVLICNQQSVYSQFYIINLLRIIKLIKSRKITDDKHWPRLTHKACVCVTLNKNYGEIIL